MRRGGGDSGLGQRPRMRELQKPEPGRPGETHGARPLQTARFFRAYRWLRVTYDLRCAFLLALNGLKKAV